MPRRVRPRTAWATAAALAAGVLQPAGVAAVPPPGCARPGPVYPVAPLPPGHSEVSGLAASARYPGWGWAVRDSGNPARVYAVRFRRSPADPEKPIVRPFTVSGADNTDWEDIAYATNADGTGRLYVVESGQSRRDRFIYKLGEPDPRGPSRPLPSRRYRYSYPDGPYNTEAAFFSDDRLVLVTKTSPARVYRFDARLREGVLNRPRFLGVLREAPYVSVVRVSRDGRLLIAATHQQLFVYASRPGTSGVASHLGRRPVQERRIGLRDNVEAGDFFPARSCRIVLVAESRNVYRSEPSG